ncbi:hypothetical protein P22_1657 [Propionispora sp. 2/2-37]|uniref:ArsR/SmtB family transcription factor n=1 Tax=Propionispora sp. 2/2-37 TaxID=1677858 RepID=UPI0006BB94FE|nr:metalloregulator ArsR/SmtB family transcription factor [Propionispora sp. 2/2-37]CUH95584.1 hypothetical protein P22_1657 [Propionispora sp. 2/2-37]
MNSLSVIFKAFGDETRLKIIEMLLGKELCVCDILEAFDKTQPVISHHLKILKHAGLVTDVRDGKWIYYSLAPEVFELVSSFFRRMDHQLGKNERQHPCSQNRK